MPITDVRKRPNGLIDDSNKELKSFTVRLSAVSGTKRGQQRGSFVGSVLGLVDNFYETVVQHLKPWTPPTPSQRKLADADGAASDQISGELPLKSVQRASSPPDWDPPEQPADDAGSDLVYARTDQFDAGAELDAATPARSPDGEWSDGRAEIVVDDVLD